MLPRGDRRPSGLRPMLPRVRRTARFVLAWQESSQGSAGSKPKATRSCGRSGGHSCLPWSRCSSSAGRAWEWFQASSCSAASTGRQDVVPDGTGEPGAGEEVPARPDFPWRFAAVRAGRRVGRGVPSQGEVSKGADSGPIAESARGLGSVSDRNRSFSASFRQNAGPGNPSPGPGVLWRLLPRASRTG